MPELPEVERGRRLAEAVAAGRIIDRVRVADDSIVFEGVSARRIRSALRGARVDAVCRHGKHLWFELDRRPWPLFHFGMTGAFVIPNDPGLQLASGPRAHDRQWPPRFWKILLLFEDGGELGMTNARRLGRIRLRHDPRRESPIADLGFDPLTALPRIEGFRAALGRRKAVLKGLLLDQSFAAGVGNWIADEVLFQAKLDPRRTVDTLRDAEVRRLHRALKNVVCVAVRANADKAKFPRGWLFHARWGKREDARVGSQRVEFLTVAGRTTAWVPSRQA